MRRRMSQLDLASAAGISARHLSFVETGRSRPSREMVLHLAENLDVPLRERNPLLMAAGYAPTYQATDFDAPEMQSVRDALERLLAAHEPYPAILVDRRWQLVSANQAATVLVEGVAPELHRADLQRAAREPAPEGSRAADREHRASGARTSSTICGARSRSRATTSCASSNASWSATRDDMGVAVPPRPRRHARSRRRCGCAPNRVSSR